MLSQLLLLFAALLCAGAVSATELVRVRVSQFTGAEPLSISSASHPALFVLDPSIASADLTADNPAVPIKEDDGPGNWFPVMTPLRPGVPVPGTIELTITPVAAPVVFGRLHFRTAARFPGNPSSFVLSWSKDAFASPLDLIDMNEASTRTLRLEAPASDEVTTFRWTAGSDFGDFGGGQSGFGGVDIVVTTALCEDPPAASCGTPARGSLSLEGDADPAHRKLAWSWSEDPVALAPLPDPTAAPLFAFCLYDERGLAMESVIGPDLCGKKQCWKQQSQGFSYKDKDGSQAGLTALKVRVSAKGVSGSLKGAGAMLELPLPLAAGTGVKAQLVRSDGADCWETNFPPPAETDEALEFEDSLP